MKIIYHAVIKPGETGAIFEKIMVRFLQEGNITLNTFAIKTMPDNASVKGLYIINIKLLTLYIL